MPKAYGTPTPSMASGCFVAISGEARQGIFLAMALSQLLAEVFEA